MNVHVNVRNTKDKVVLPQRVLEAFEHHHQIWKGMGKDSCTLMFMAIPFTTVHGQSLVLKEFANNHPTEYVRAIANGYTSEKNPEQELVEMITEWMNAPWKDMETGVEDAKELARKIIQHIK